MDYLSRVGNGEEQENELELSELNMRLSQQSDMEEYCIVLKGKERCFMRIWKTVSKSKLWVCGLVMGLIRPVDVVHIWSLEYQN